jgi:hypothetical protein
MKIQHALIVAALGLTLHASAQAAPQTYLCPQSIPEASVHLVAPGQAWKPFVASPLYLNGAAPADGPPERRGVLRETTSTKTKAGWTRTYALDGRYPEGKWLRCDYGAFGEVALAKPLPDETQACTVTGTKGEHVGENKVEVRCL